MGGCACVQCACAHAHVLAPNLKKDKRPELEGEGGFAQLCHQKEQNSSQADEAETTVYSARLITRSSSLRLRLLRLLQRLLQLGQLGQALRAELVDDRREHLGDRLRRRVAGHDVRVRLDRRLDLWGGKRVRWCGGRQEAGLRDGVEATRFWRGKPRVEVCSVERSHTRGWSKCTTVPLSMIRLTSSISAICDTPIFFRFCCSLESSPELDLRTALWVLRTPPTRDAAACVYVCVCAALQKSRQRCRPMCLHTKNKSKRSTYHLLQLLAGHTSANHFERIKSCCDRSLEESGRVRRENNNNNNNKTVGKNKRPGTEKQEEGGGEGRRTKQCGSFRNNHCDERRSYRRKGRAQWKIVGRDS